MRNTDGVELCTENSHDDAVPDNLNGSASDEED